MESAAVTAGFMAFLTEMLRRCCCVPAFRLARRRFKTRRWAVWRRSSACFTSAGPASARPTRRAQPGRAFSGRSRNPAVRAEAARRFHLLLKSASTPGADGGANPFTALMESVPASLISDDAGLWCDLLVTQPCAVLSAVSPRATKGRKSNGAFVMNVGDAGPKVAKMLKHYRELAKDAIEQSTVDGCIEYHLKIEVSIAPCRFGTSQEAGKEAVGYSARRGKGRRSRASSLDPADKYLIVVWGDESPAEIVKRMKGPEPEWLTAVGKDLPIERRAAIVRVDLEAVAAPFAKGNAAEQDIAKQIRDTHLHAVTLVTGLGHDDFESQVLVETDGIAGALMKTMVDRPLKAEDLAVIPRDATLAMALRVDPNLIATGLHWIDRRRGNRTREPRTAGKGKAAKRAVLPSTFPISTQRS